MPSRSEVQRSFEIFSSSRVDIARVAAAVKPRAELSGAPYPRLIRQVMSQTRLDDEA